MSVRGAMIGFMHRQEFWEIIEAARLQAPDQEDGDEVAGLAGSLLAELPPGEIIAAQQVLWDLMADSYSNPLWAAAYVINGGCSDDGFDYFRGWLIVQGREVFESTTADPDLLAGLPTVRSAATDGRDLGCEVTLSIAWDAHIRATGEPLPDHAWSIRYPDLDPAWDFDFDDATELTRRLPRLAALYL